MPRFDRHLFIVILTATTLGILGVCLALWGNPENSGICVSCFIENSAGALGMHNNNRMQYLRPELIGFVLGAFGSALAFREFRSRGGSAPMMRFLSGLLLIIGCGAFIGCPIKMFLRLTAGDLTALAGLVGLVAGVWAGLKCLGGGVELGPGTCQRGGSGIWVPALFMLMLVLYFTRPGFVIFSTTGSAVQHAPFVISLAAGLVLGVLAQRTRFCITGGLRDAFLIGLRSPLAWGLLGFFVSSLFANILTGQFRLGLYGQPGSHFDFTWSFLGMVLVGWVSVLIGGCPFRQLIKAGEGDSDAGMVVLGMLAGGGLVQGWSLAATASGVPFYGKIAVLTGLAIVVITSLLFRERTA